MMTAEQKERRLAAGRRAHAVQQQRAQEKRSQDAVFRGLLLNHIVRLQEAAVETRAHAETLGEYDRGRFVLEAMAFERELAASSLRHILLLSAPEIIAGKAV